MSYIRIGDLGSVIPASRMPQSLPGDHGMIHGLSPDTHWPQYQAAGYRRYVPFEAPVGMVTIPSSRSTTDDGDTITEHYEVQSAAEAKAAAAATAATDAARQAADDAAAHAPDLAALAAALAAFGGITPGMLYPAIEDLMAAQVASADPSAVAPLTAASLRAMSVYSRLASAGISGARLWRALAALATLSTQPQPTTEETP
jgi:hypothetical protein